MGASSSEDRTPDPRRRKVLARLCEAFFFVVILDSATLRRNPCGPFVVTGLMPEGSFV